MSDVIDPSGLAALLDGLRARGYQLIGPTVRDGVVVHAEITSIADLPRGVTDEQAPGRYRLHGSEGSALFAFASVATSWKPFLQPARRPVWSSATPDEAPVPVPQVHPRRALIGVRSCDLHAIAIQDDIARRRAPESDAPRSDTFVVAVSCGHPGSTCFCTSMGTGPRAAAGFDLALIELTDGGDHRFVVEVGSDAGRELLAGLPTRPAGPADTDEADRVVEVAAASMGRRVDTTGLRDLLYDSADSPRWDEVASRCLSCASCTLVCPTCFCVSTTETVDLTGAVARGLEWSSCFVPEHSHLHGGPVRQDTSSRYRQWLTHKFASWIDQFGTSGCVGCGRCVTWCPVGIDVTEELAALRVGAGESPEVSG